MAEPVLADGDVHLQQLESKLNLILCACVTADVRGDKQEVTLSARQKFFLGGGGHILVGSGALWRRAQPSPRSDQQVRSDGDIPPPLPLRIIRGASFLPRLTGDSSRGVGVVEGDARDVSARLHQTRIRARLERRVLSRG